MRQWAVDKIIRRFIFRPESAGLVGIDCDIKNGKNGVNALIEIIGNIENLPYTTTPTGGRHYYFLAEKKDFISCEICPGIEVKHRGLITLPGSCRDDGNYNFHGDPGDIKPLPIELKKIIPARGPESEHIRIPPEYECLPLKKISEILLCQGLGPMPGNRNRYSFEYARFAKKMGHRPESVLRYLSYLESDDFRHAEIKAAVNSAFNGGGR